MSLQRAGWVLLGAASAAIIYWRVILPKMRHWGASEGDFYGRSQAMSWSSGPAGR